jgi:hypothetical protein
MTDWEGIMAPPDVHRALLRAYRPEAGLHEAEEKLARLLRMADSWSRPDFPTPSDAAVFADAVRTVILP